jgi:hypothetical protein
LQNRKEVKIGLKISPDHITLKKAVIQKTMMQGGYRRFHLSGAVDGLMLNRYSVCIPRPACGPPAADRVRGN